MCVLVLPTDGRTEPLIVQELRRRRANATLLIALVGVEGTPFRTPIKRVFVENQTTVSTE
jgi:hypothetical protein